jgi:hypothetical protein
MSRLGVAVQGHSCIRVYALFSKKSQAIGRANGGSGFPIGHDLAKKLVLSRPLQSLRCAESLASFHHINLEQGLAPLRRFSVCPVVIVRPGWLNVEQKVSGMCWG